MAKKVFVPDEKMQEIVATGGEPLQFHAITEPGFMLDCGASPKKLGFGGRIRFQTNSAHVMLRFALAPKSCRPHPTQTYQGTCGFDIYLGVPGHEKYYYTTRTTQPKGDFQIVNGHGVRGETFREFTLHLPLFAKVKSLEIGLDKDAAVKAPTKLKATPIAILGGDLANGRSASRPGMSLGNQLARLLKRPVFTAENPKALGEQVIEIAFVLQGPGEKSLINNNYNLMKINNLYHIKWPRLKAMLGNDPEPCFTDTTHLNDLGLRQLALGLAKLLETSR